MNLIDLAERAVLPDWLIRLGMRRLMAGRLQDEQRQDAGQPGEAMRRFVQELRRSPIAIHTDAANVQHYEVPTEFFRRVLGPRLKYSCCYWPRADTTLGQAEDAMLELFCRRAGIEDGMAILELGCGWGSLCLWIAEHFPNCRVLAISNSETQRQFIESRCRDLGRNNVEVQTANVADFGTERQFDRVLSLEPLGFRQPDTADSWRQAPARPPEGFPGLMSRNTFLSRGAGPVDFSQHPVPGQGSPGNPSHNSESRKPVSGGGF